MQREIAVDRELEVAGEGRDGRDPPAGAHEREALLDRVTADEVDHGVHLAHGIGDLRDGVAARVVEHQCGAERAEVVVRRGAADCDDMGAALDRELRREAADAARGAEDKHALVALQVEAVHDLVGGARGERYGGRLDCVRAPRACAPRAPPGRPATRRSCPAARRGSR